jgi:sugar (pentulose or hexulose) kinase
MDDVIGCDVGSQGVEAVRRSREGRLAPAQLDGVVAVDAAGQPLRPAMIWMARRAVSPGAAVARAADPARLSRLSGARRAVGGGARSRRWRQSKAGVTGLPVERPRTTGTPALGAAMLALVASGACASLAETAARVVRVVETVGPRPAGRARDEDCDRLYRAASVAPLPVFEAAARGAAP